MPLKLLKWPMAMKQINITLIFPFSQLKSRNYWSFDALCARPKWLTTVQTFWINGLFVPIETFNNSLFAHKKPNIKIHCTTHHFMLWLLIVSNILDTSNAPLLQSSSLTMTIITFAIIKRNHIVSTRNFFFSFCCSYTSLSHVSFKCMYFRSINSNFCCCCLFIYHFY